jgi:hypothetical protein
VIGGVFRCTSFSDSSFYLSSHFYSIKSKIIAGRLLTIAFIIFAGGIVDLWFNAVPRQIVDKTAPEGFTVSPFLSGYLSLDLLAIAGFGSLVIGLFLRASNQAETIPVHDPRILESINYHE